MKAGLFKNIDGTLKADYRWVNYLNIDKCQPYPLQFANIERLRRNEAVFIFDETGSGKTISTGLMALDYLCNHQNKKVLILTTTSLTREAPDNLDGQFLGDWLDKLPFDALALKQNVTVCNNVSCNIHKLCKEWGLIIIDEAHEYLYAERRRDELFKLKADKIVLLTATPIRRDEDDLKEYANIAEKVLKKEIDKGWLGCIPKNKNEVICSTFDLNVPVTRYFKDTMTALKYIKDGKVSFEKEKAIRKIPEIWTYTSDKIKTIFDKIEKIAQNQKTQKVRDRFIIFTREIKSEQDLIENYLKNNEKYINYDSATKEDSDKLTYVIINAKSEHLVSEFSHNGKDGDEMPPLPDIMVVQYQIAEAGVNLPGYNYVINYYIPTSTASLEQRFGRIDRMGNSGSGTLYDEINMIYPVSEANVYWELSNEKNFLIALRQYIRQLITNLPSKNTIFTKEILAYYKKHLKEGYFDDEINRIKIMLAKCQDAKNKGITSDLLQDKDIKYFIENNEINFEKKDVISLKEIETIIDSLEDEIKNIETDKNNQAVVFNDKFLDDIKDNIFFLFNREMYTLNPISDCAKKIYDSKAYKDFVKDFEYGIEGQLVLEKYKDKIEEYLEDKFLTIKEGCENFWSGDFEAIYGSDNIEILNSALPQNVPEKELLREYCTDEWMDTLPFFEMVRTYGENISKSLNSNLGYTPDRVHNSVFPLALIKTKYKMPGKIKKWYEENISKNREATQFFYNILKPYPEDSTYVSDIVIECSNILKLTFISSVEFETPGLIRDYFRYIKNGCRNDQISEKMKGVSEKKNLDLFFRCIYTDSYEYRKWCRGYFWENKDWTILLPKVQSGRGYLNVKWEFINTDIRNSKIPDLISYSIYRLLLKGDNNCFNKKIKFGSKDWLENTKEDIDKMKRQVNQNGL